MRKLFVFALIVMAIILAINIAVRPGNPVFDVGNVFPALKDHEALLAALAGFLKPGTYVLYYFGIDPDSGYELIAAVLLSWWTWHTAIRLSWISSAGRSASSTWPTSTGG